MSFDINRAIEQGEKDAKAAERAKRSGARAGRGGRGGFSRSAGRAAVGKMKIRGRGASLNAHANGKSFKRRGDYVMNALKGAELIFANSDIRSMQAAAKLRPDIKEPVGHISMSLPPSSGKRTKEEWLALVETARDQLGLDDTFPMLVARHQDTDHDHVHFLFSRVSVTGKCHDQRNLGLKCAAVERILEDRHSLKLVPPSEFKTSNSRTTKNEIELGVRTHQKPPRMQIASALEIATQGRPTVQQFVERLQAAGVGVRANVASTGKMNGFSFSFQGVEFGASKIGKKYGWATLRETIDYDQARDHKFTAQLDGNPGAAGETLARAIATVDQLNTAVAAVSPAAPNTTTDSGNDPTVADRAVQRDPETRTAASSRAAGGDPRKQSQLDIETTRPARLVGNRIALSKPDGFARADLTSNLDNLDYWTNNAGWIGDTMILPTSSSLYNDDGRLLAIETRMGWYITSSAITQNQLKTLIAEAQARNPDLLLQATGDYKICAAISKAASASGQVVNNHYFRMAEEKRAAEQRLAARAAPDHFEEERLTPK